MENGEKERKIKFPRKPQITQRVLRRFVGKKGQTKSVVCFCFLISLINTITQNI